MIFFLISPFKTYHLLSYILNTDAQKHTDTHLLQFPVYFPGVGGKMLKAKGNTNYLFTQRGLKQGHSRLKEIFPQNTQVESTETQVRGGCGGVWWGEGKESCCK